MKTEIILYCNLPGFTVGKKNVCLSLNSCSSLTLLPPLCSQYLAQSVYFASKRRKQQQCKRYAKLQDGIKTQTSSAPQVLKSTVKWRQLLINEIISCGGI